MIHARDEDFVDIMAIFKKYKEWLGHIRHDYVKQMIMNNAKKFDFTSNFISKHKGTSLLIFERDVALSYSVYKVNRKIGTTSAKKGDCILHQICAKNRDGSASDVLQRFFKFVNHNPLGKRVYLSVRSDNEMAKNFYLKNNMKLIGKTSWSKGTLPGEVFVYDPWTYET